VVTNSKLYGSNLFGIRIRSYRRDLGVAFGRTSGFGYKSLNGLATLMTPRASEQPSGLLVGKSDEESSDHGYLLWLCKAVVF